MAGEWATYAAKTGCRPFRNGGNIPIRTATSSTCGETPVAYSVDCSDALDDR